MVWVDSTVWEFRRQDREYLRERECIRPTVMLDDRWECVWAKESIMSQIKKSSWYQMPEMRNIQFLPTNFLSFCCFRIYIIFINYQIIKLKLKFLALVLLCLCLRKEVSWIQKVDEILQASLKTKRRIKIRSHFPEKIGRKRLF